MSAITPLIFPAIIFPPVWFLVYFNRKKNKRRTVLVLHIFTALLAVGVMAGLAALNKSGAFRG